MAANSYTIGQRRTAAAAALDPVHERIDCDWSARSSAGAELARNADAWRALPEDGLFVVADGFGGHNAGDVASRLVVDRLASAIAEDRQGANAGETTDLQFSEPGKGAIRQVLDAVHRLERVPQLATHISTANADILAVAARRPECLGMASTVACLWLDERSFCIAHVGNSRIYLLRGTRFVRLTRDHVMASPAEANGPIALSRVLGARESVDVDVRESDWYHGDRLLLCTDGLTSQVSDARIADVMQGATNAAECVQTLQAAALAAGGHDSVTAIAVFLSRSFTDA